MKNRNSMENKAEEEITHFSNKIFFLLLDKFWVLTIADNSMIIKMCTDLARGLNDRITLTNVFGSKAKEVYTEQIDVVA